MKKNMMMKASNRIGGWAKKLLLCLLLPCLGVYADPWEAWSGHIHQEYTGPWKWTESNIKTTTQGDTTRITCDATITGYTGNSTDLTIPEKITMTTTVNGDGVSIRLEYEATVKSIRERAFYYYDRIALTSVKIPDSVTNIGYEAFCHCTALTNVTIPNNDNLSWECAFEECTAIQTVTIPDKVKSVDNGAFCQCSSLREVKIGNSITNIGAGAFYQCNSLTNAIIPYGVTRIGGGLCEFVGDATWFAFGAFYGCSSLESVTIPNTVTSIGTNAFFDCSNLRDVYLSDIVVWCAIDFDDIYANPFRYAQNLYLNGELVTVLEIPDGVPEISNYAFYNCDCLKSISIPDSVARAYGAFSGCNNITSATVPQSVMSYGLSSTFRDSYQNLSALRLCANVSAIGVNEFGNCRALTSVTVADGNTSYVVLDDGCLYDTARNLILFCPRDKASITIPNGVTAIGNYAFQYCTNLVSASMPETVQSIGSASFVGCAKLSGLTIPSSVQTLPTAAFNGCDVLWTEWYRALANLSVNGGGSSSGGNVEPVDPRYALAASPADRAIASVTVDGDCAIDQFVLTDAKVYDTVLRIINVSDSPAQLSLPSGYSYERLKGTTPLTIPASSTNLLTITRTADRVFFVSREQMESAQ